MDCTISFSSLRTDQLELIPLEKTNKKPHPQQEGGKIGVGVQAQRRVANKRVKRVTVPFSMYAFAFSAFCLSVCLCVCVGTFFPDTQIFEHRARSVRKLCFTSFQKTLMLEFS